MIKRQPHINLCIWCCKQNLAHRPIATLKPTWCYRKLYLGAAQVVRKLVTLNV